MEGSPFKQTTHGNCYQTDVRQKRLEHQSWSVHMPNTVKRLIKLHALEVCITLVEGTPNK